MRSGVTSGWGRTTTSIHQVASSANLMLTSLLHSSLLHTSPSTLHFYSSPLHTSPSTLHFYSSPLHTSPSTLHFYSSPLHTSVIYRNLLKSSAKKSQEETAPGVKSSKLDITSSLVLTRNKATPSPETSLQISRNKSPDTSGVSETVHVVETSYYRIPLLPSPPLSSPLLPSPPLSYPLLPSPTLSSPLLPSPTFEQLIASQAMRSVLSLTMMRMKVS